MANHQFRGILLRLQDRLSNDDRRRLHFFLGDDIPRRIRDDPSLEGTLSLMESLFDQDKINGEDFTFLIDALDEIQCQDAAKLLRGSFVSSLNEFGLLCLHLEYRNGLRGLDLTGSHTSLNTILPTLFEVDHFDVRGRAPIEETPMLEKGTMFPSLSNPSSLFDLREKASRVFLLIVVFLVGVLIVCAVLSSFGLKKIDQLKRQVDDRDKQVSELKDNLAEQNDKDKPVVKYGETFGVSVGFRFDDSDSDGFKFGYYFSGMNVGLITDDLESYQFRYSAQNHSDHIHSKFHGQHSSTRPKFDFDRSERITLVELSLRPIERHLANGTNATFDAVTGLRFFSSDNRWSFSSVHPERERPPLRENFTGYTLGYIRGRVDRYLHQIQFVWYRTN